MVKKKTKKSPKMWVYVGPRKVSPEEKEQIEKAFAPVIAKLKEDHIIEKPPKNSNYISDIQSKWYRHYFYLYSNYKCPSPTAIIDGFENKFARLEYMGKDQFHLSFMRYTGEWVELGHRIPLKECIQSILEGDFFQP